MIQGAAVLRGVLNTTREAARRGVSGICVANESHWKAIPAARLATPTVSRSGVLMNCASRGRRLRASDTARNTDFVVAVPGILQPLFEALRRDPKATRTR